MVFIGASERRALWARASETSAEQLREREALLDFDDSINIHCTSGTTGVVVQAFARIATVDNPRTPSHTVLAAVGVELLSSGQRTRCPGEQPHILLRRRVLALRSVTAADRVLNPLCRQPTIVTGMSTTVPRHKGTGFVPVVTALNAHPLGRQAVPPAQRYYLDNYVVATEWYPEADWNVLLLSLANALEADGIPDVWRYFGRVAAQRDLKGNQQDIPVERRVDVAGVYRRFGTEERSDIVSALDRLGKLWSLYHDTGRFHIGRSTSDDCCVVLRVSGYHIADTNLLELFSAYFTEYLRIVGNPAEARVTRATCYGDAFNEWEFHCERTPENSRALDHLPVPD